MAALIPNARIELLEGLPHNIGDAAPERCVRVLLEFLAARGG
jgi:pimeloyl-ACP methyl ester carboxylesterase